MEVVRNKCAGESSFSIFLGVVSDAGCSFEQKDPLNTGDFAYFFNTGGITDTDTISTILSYKKSLSYAHDTIKILSDKNVAFYFGVRVYNLEYGFVDMNSQLLYKVGEFYTSSRSMKNIYHPCLTGIKKYLDKVNIKDILILHKVKSPLVNIFTGHSGTTCIIDENNVKVCFYKQIFRPQDVDVEILSRFVNRWLVNHNLYNVFYANVVIDEETVNFVLKIRKNKVMRITI